jgi:maleylpyruvate isomerase
VDDELIEMAEMIDDATRRLLVTVSSLDQDAVAAPSLLPGWSRGHVLAHLARNADALRNLLIWARTGVVTPGYPSKQARDDDISAGAGRPAARQHADIAASAAAFRSEAAQLPAEAWQAEVGMLGAELFRARLVLPRRLVEVELHHTDLGCGYTRAGWPAAFAAMDLPEPMRTFRATRLAVAAVRGPAAVRGACPPVSAWRNVQGFNGI